MMSAEFEHHARGTHLDASALGPLEDKLKRDLDLLHTEESASWPFCHTCDSASIGRERGSGTVGIRGQIERRTRTENVAPCAFAVRGIFLRIFNAAGRRASEPRKA